MAEKDPWGVKSVAPIANDASAVDPWGTPATPQVAGLPPGVQPPAFPGAPPVNMQMSKVGKLFGSPDSYVGVPAQHVENMVSGVAHAALDSPQDATESAISGMTGQPTLAAYRAFVKPTVESGAQAIDYAKQGKWGRAGQSAMDAIPIAGPWARNVENDAEQYGAIPAMLGLGTDIAAPMGAAKGMGLAMRGAGAVAQGIGKAGEYLGATPEARKLANTRILVPGEAGDVLTRALKPSVSSQVGPSNIASSLPDILKQNPNPQNLGEFGAATDASKAAKNSQYEAWLGPNGNVPLDTTPMVRPQINSIPATNRFETPGIIDTTARQASPYDMTPRQITTTSPILDQFGKPITNTKTISPQKPSLRTVDEIRKDTNAKLNSFYNKDAGDKNAALSNPETARIKAVNDSSRNLVYDKLSALNNVPESDIRENQNAYGTLSNIGDVANNRETVFGRHDPVSLPEKIAVSHGIKNAILDYGTQKFLKNSTDSNALIRSGIDRFNNPDGTPLPAAPGMFAQSISGAGKFTGDLGSGTDILGRKVSGRAGQAFVVPPKKKR